MISEFKPLFRQAAWFAAGLSVGSGLVAARYAKLDNEAGHDTKLYQAYQRTEALKKLYGHQLYVHHIPLERLAP